MNRTGRITTSVSLTMPSQINASHITINLSEL